jgi:hypothetical protein
MTQLSDTGNRLNNTLPIVRCTILNELVALIKKEQLARKTHPEYALKGPEQVVFNPLTDKPYREDDLGRVRLSDLLEVKLDHQGDVTEVVSKQKFHWEEWAVDAEAVDTVVRYDYVIRLGNIDYVWLGCPV